MFSNLVVSLVFAACFLLVIGENQTAGYQNPENQTAEIQTGENHEDVIQTEEKHNPEDPTGETSLSNDTNSMFSNLFTQTNNLLSYLTSENNEDNPASEDTKGRIALLYLT